ncbi:MAG: tetracycline regulation of excision, RteC [Flavobacterium psychrophilum]|nr:MAG: tetracycline regulation of excision, RteC [Flavobacterium psychrophilum]
MVRSAVYRDILSEVNENEKDFSISYSSVIEQASTMIPFLQETLRRLKDILLKDGFTNTLEEVEYFREVKPQVLGKLIYYNELYRLETSCPVQGGKLYRKYFAVQLKLLKQHNASQMDMDFYRYYRSGRTDRDNDYFKRGQICLSTVPDSFYFEMDARYSTYYDHLVARFIAQDLIYTFLLSRINPDNPGVFGDFEIPEELQWTGTKNALIELIYALHTSGALSNGKIGVRKVSQVFQAIFKISLGDVHHAFHRMKDRSAKRTLFIDQLKNSLEDYMDKNL